MRELLNARAQDITTLETSSREFREERERLQFRYNKLGLSMVTAQEELEEAKTLAGANAVATASMTRQIEVLVEDQIIRRQELDLMRRQLDASTTSALDAQSRLWSRSDRPSRGSLTPAAPTGAPLTRATISGVTNQFLPDPLSYMYAGSSDRGRHRRGSRDRDDESEDRRHRSSSRRPREHGDDSRDRPTRTSGSRHSRDRSDISEDRPHRLSGSRRPRGPDGRR